MKLIKNILYIFLGGFILFSCSEDESFKDLNTQVFIYPITVNDDGIVDRLTELAYDENSEREVTVRIAIFPRQSSATTVSYEFRSIDDPEVASATEGSDFEVLSDKTVTIPANQDFVDVTFRVLNDLDTEPDEQFIFYLTDAGNATLLEGSRQYRFTIRSSDQPVSAFLAEESVSFLEGDTYNYTIELSEALETDLTVNYTVGGTATSGDDFTALSGSVLFPAGTQEVDIPIDVTNRGGLEFDETIVITITSVVGNGVVADPDDDPVVGTITIEDNSLDPPASDYAFALTWDDPTTADLAYTLWEDTGADTVEIVTSNNPADFESLVLENTQGDGTFLVTATWLSGSAAEVDYVSYIALNGFEQLSRKSGTIENMNEPVFLYTINRATETDVQIE